MNSAPPLTLPAAREVFPSRAHLVPHTDWFVNVPLAEYLRDIHRSTIPVLPVTTRPAHESGLLFHTLEIARTANLPQTTALSEQARQSLPTALREDAGASWREWPMRHRPNLP